MIAIKLVDARRGLNIKCRELFKDEKIAESIYRYLCDGIEECDDVETEQNGYWRHYEGYLICSECGAEYYDEIMEYCGDDVPKFCPNCGKNMERME